MGCRACLAACSLYVCRRHHTACHTHLHKLEPLNWVSELNSHTSLVILPGNKFDYFLTPSTLTVFFMVTDGLFSMPKQQQQRFWVRILELEPGLELGSLTHVSHTHRLASTRRESSR